MSGAVTTHVLDTARGIPAAGVAVRLERRARGTWVPVGEGTTDADGRCRGLTTGGLEPGTHRLVFATGEYAAARGPPSFYPEVVVTFDIADAAAHFHVPLLLSPFGYSTYRGS